MRHELRAAVIGAGMSGLSCASELRAAGVRVTVFDKGRGPAGRLSTRRAPYAFDHGAQYFTARDPDFEARVAGWVRDGVAAEWAGLVVAIDRVGEPPRPTSELRRYVGVPGMSALALNLAEGIDVRQQVTVTGLDRAATTWRLRTSDQLLPDDFDIVVLTPPPVQTTALLDGVHPFADDVGQAALAPCWALMAAFDGPVDVAWDGAFINDGPLAWAARNGSKPGRTAPHTWVLHASSTWSTEHLEDTREEVTAHLLSALAALAARPLPPTTFVQAHRWRYAAVTRTLDARSLWDAVTGVGVAGDYCRGPRVEGAWLSGRDLARRILHET